MMPGHLDDSASRRQLQTPRYGGRNGDLDLATGWTCHELLPASQLIGANGICLGPDGELYIAENWGSEISKVNIDTGVVTLICRADGPVTAPDDLAFDDSGRLFITELQAARVGVLEPDGRHSVVAEGLPCVNGIATLGNRLFANEFRAEGRIVEINPETGELRDIVTGVDWPNGMSVTPDERIYYPNVMAGEVWRLSLDGTENVCIARDLKIPTAVKHSSAGYVCTTEHGGRVVRIDPQSGRKDTVVELNPGLDNLTFGTAHQLFVSNSCYGTITEIDVAAGSVTREIVPPGLMGPLGLTLGPRGSIVVVDPFAVFELDRDGGMARIATDSSVGYPGVLRDVCRGSGDTYVFSTTGGVVAQWDGEHDSTVVCDGLDTVIGLASDSQGNIAVAESGAGRVSCIDPRGGAKTLAADLDQPFGVAAGREGAWYVSDVGAGCVWEVEKGKKRVIAEDLREPQGVAYREDGVFVVERGAARLVRISPTTGGTSVVASGLPVGLPGAKVLPGVASMVPGPWLPFADLVVGSDGSLLVGADGVGSVLEFRNG
jgi:sugar lactone lactonase YvrE